MHDTGQPLVSVCVPVYNGATYLREAMASVIDQSYTRIEIIVIDDMSTDDSWGIVNSFADSRIVAVRNARNLGPEANFNKLLAVATGDYVKLFAQDDVLAPTVSRFRFAPWKTIRVPCLHSARGGSLALKRAPSLSGPTLGVRCIRGSRLIKECLSNGTNMIGEPAAVMFRRSAAEVAGKFTARLPYVIDLDYWVRLRNSGRRSTATSRSPAFACRQDSGVLPLPGDRPTTSFSSFPHTPRLMNTGTTRSLCCSPNCGARQQCA